MSRTGGRIRCAFCGYPRPNHGGRRPTCDRYGRAPYRPWDGDPSPGPGRSVNGGHWPRPAYQRAERGSGTASHYGQRVAPMDHTWQNSGRHLLLGHNCLLAKIYGRGMRFSRMLQRTVPEPRLGTVQRNTRWITRFLETLTDRLEGATWYGHPPGAMPLVLCVYVRGWELEATVRTPQALLTAYATIDGMLEHLQSDDGRRRFEALVEATARELL